MKKHLLIALAALVTTAGQANAQIPVQNFKPVPGGDNNYINSYGTAVLQHLKPSFGLWLDYANKPLVLKRTSTGEEINIIEHRLGLDLQGAIGLFDFLELGISVPVVLWQATGDGSGALAPPNVKSTVAGDIRIFPKWSILHDPEGFGLSLAAPLTLPTGSAENLSGEGSLTVEPRLTLQYIISDQLRVAGSIGYTLREKKQLYNVDVKNGLRWDAAVEYQIVKDEFGLILEGWGEAPVAGDNQSEEFPTELALAARYWPSKPHALTLGVSRGLTDGFGAPVVRVFAGYTYTGKEDLDLDGDGILNRDDACPQSPEDFDKFQDEDGCPELDNDKDGLKDSTDKCPNEPEDYDGHEDNDGCPDEDNDGDGIKDADDTCPNKPEDADGFEDADGCPDFDNDKDGLPDVSDGEVGADGFGACMNEPEDMDGYQDEDGCVDPDNDGDGILDVDDECPDDPEDDCNVRMVNRCEIQIVDKVYFHYDKDTIKKKSFAILDAVAEVLVKNQWIKKLEVQGHTDSDGTPAYNKELSQRRVNAVVAYMAEKGVDASRLVGTGKGEGDPIADNKTASGRSKNRRVMFFILDPNQENCQK